MSLVEFVNTYLLSDTTGAILICAVFILASIWIGWIIIEVVIALLKW
jgi:hypothetical protein